MQLQDLATAHLVPARGPQQRADRPLGRDRLEAAAIAAAADDAVRVHLDVTDLAGEAGGAVVEAPADDEPGADAGAEADVDDVGEAAAGAEGRLGERAQVRVVVDLD